MSKKLQDTAYNYGAKTRSRKPVDWKARALKAEAELANVKRTSDARHATILAMCKRQVEDHTELARLRAELAKAREAAQLLDTLCSWLLHRFGPNTPEGMEAAFRQTKARTVLEEK
jgi:hypothetical protein